MNSEFNWWLLIVGLVVGAGLVWLILADSRRREIDVAERERQGEARWIGEALRSAGRPIDDRTALDVLRLHEAYLGAPPPDEFEADDEEGGPAVETPSDAPAEPQPGSGFRTWRTTDPDNGPADPRRPMAHPLAADEQLGPTGADRPT